jgi:hypothetical protein
MGSALQPPFLRQSVAVAATGKMSPGRLRAMARMYFGFAAIIACSGFIIAVTTRGFMRVGGALEMFSALCVMGSGIQMLRTARAQRGGTSGG